MAAYTALGDFGALVGGPMFGALIHAAGYPFAYGVAAAVLLLGVALFAVVGGGRDDRKGSAQ